MHILIDRGKGGGEKAPVRAERAWFLSLHSSLGKISVLTTPTLTPAMEKEILSPLLLFDLNLY